LAQRQACRARSATLKTYAEPVIGVLPVQSIDTALVMKIIEPLWSTKPETASRLRGRIEAVLDWATVRGYRQGDNPARWRGSKWRWRTRSTARLKQPIAVVTCSKSAAY